MSVTSIRLNAEIEAPLESLTKKLDRSRNYLINQAIKEFVQRQEMSEQRWNGTLEALDSVSQDRLVADSEVSDWLNSWGTEDEKLPVNKKPSKA